MSDPKGPDGGDRTERGVARPQIVDPHGRPPEREHHQWRATKYVQRAWRTARDRFLPDSFRRRAERWRELPYSDTATALGILFSALGIVATIISLLILNATLRATRASVETSRRSAEAHNRPWVLLDFQAAQTVNERGLCVRLKNFGSAPAFQIGMDVQFAEPDGSLCKPHAIGMRPADGPGYPIIPPQQSMNFYLPREHFPAGVPWEGLVRLAWRDQYANDTTHGRFWADICVHVDESNPLPSARVTNCWECNTAKYCEISSEGYFDCQPPDYPEQNTPDPNETSPIIIMGGGYRSLVADLRGICDPATATPRITPTSGETMTPSAPPTPTPTMRRKVAVRAIAKPSCAATPDA